MRPPPSSITRLTGFVCTPILWKNFAASFGLATTLMRSPASRVKLPSGMYTSCCPRSTTHTSAPDCRRPRSESFMPSSMEPGSIRILCSSTRPFENVSILMEAGARRMRAISVALASSGLSAMLSPRSS